MKCKHTHQFQIKQTYRYYPQTVRVELEGQRIVCLECGRVVDIWENGEREIVKQGDI